MPERGKFNYAGNGLSPRMPERVPNELIKEKSPYLLKHAYNPVHWKTWGNETLAKAKNDNKPIFLSIG